MLNGFVLVALLLAGEADTACIVGFVALILTFPIAILSMRLAEKVVK